MKLPWRIASFVATGILLTGLAVCLFGRHEASFEGKSLSAWLDTFYVGGGTDWRKAEVAVRQMGANTFPSVMEWLTARDSGFKSTAMKLAQQQSFIRFNFIPAQVRREQAIYVLEILGPAARPILPQLESVALSATNTSNRLRAVTALGALGTNAELSVHSLLKCLEVPDADVRSTAVLALGAIGRAPKRVVPLLVDGLKHSGQFHPAAVASALSGFGPEAASALPALAELLDDRAASFWAATALAQIGPEGVLVLTRALTNSEPFTRIQGARALHDLHAGRRSRVPLDLARLQSIGRLRGISSSMIGNNDSGSEFVAKVLGENLCHTNASVRRLSAEILGPMGINATEAIVELWQAAEDSDSSVRVAASEALAKFYSAPILEKPVKAARGPRRFSRR